MIQANIPANKAVFSFFKTNDLFLLKEGVVGFKETGGVFI